MTNFVVSPLPSRVRVRKEEKLREQEQKMKEKEEKLKEQEMKCGDQINRYSRN